MRSAPMGEWLRRLVSGGRATPAWSVALVLAAAVMTGLIAGCGGGDPQPEATAAIASVADPVDERADADGTDDADVDESADETATTTVGATPERAPTAAPLAAVDLPLDDERVVFNDDFSQTIAPILIDKCASCHNAGGPGAPHFALDTMQDAADMHLLIDFLVADESMPPWPAGPLSVPFEGDRSLRTDEIQAIRDWSAAGAPIDVDPSWPLIAADSVGLDDVDMTLEPATPYRGVIEVPDDYRCLIYDPQLTESAWMQAFEFRPDQTQVVHHAIGYRVPADQRAAADALDGADGRPGWQCYGGSGLSSDELFIGWAPGQDPGVFPDGTGLALEAGDFFVVQIHYHYDDDVPVDSSQLLLDLEPADQVLDEIIVSTYVGPAEIPCLAEESGPLCNRDAALASAVERFGRGGVRADAINALCGANPADFVGMTSGIATSTCDLPVYGFGEILAVLGHQHELGSAFRMTLNPDRDDELILLDIPEWDFDWQYNYRPADSIVLVPGDVLRIECTWDRALRDPSLPPAWVLWADGTNDEMCFSTISTRGNPLDLSTVDETRVRVTPEFTACVEGALTESVGAERAAVLSGLDGLPADVAEDEAFVDAVFGCESPEIIGQMLLAGAAQRLDIVLPPSMTTCVGEVLADRAVLLDTLASLREGGDMVTTLLGALGSC